MRRVIVQRVAPHQAEAWLRDFNALPPKPPFRILATAVAWVNRLGAMLSQISGAI